MDLKEYRTELLKREGLPITEDIILYNDFELYNMADDTKIHFKTFDEAIEYEIDGKKIKDIIADKEEIWQDDMGGRGAGSEAKAGGKLFGGRGARSGGRTVNETKNLLPSAYINTLTSSKYKTVEGTAKAFGKNFLNAEREFAGVIDKDGFALKYAKGQKTSVVHLEKKGAYSIHNHPSKALNAKDKGKTIYYNAPSTADLRNWALGQGKGTIIVASGNRTGYIVQKSNNFSGKAFTQSMNKARSTGNYDKDVDTWLRKNQKTLRYKYKKVKF